jgi:hypothetical protein
VHPAELYIGCAARATLWSAAQHLEIDFIVTDLDGAPVEDRLVTVRAARLMWKVVDGAWQEVEDDFQECSQASPRSPAPVSSRPRWRHLPHHPPR